MKIKIAPLWNQLNLEDDIGLAQQLYNVYSGEASDAGEIIQIRGDVSENYASQSTIAGFRKEDTIVRFRMNKAISSITNDESLFPYFDKVIDSYIYKALINWKDLDKYAGFLHDHEADEPEGQAQQKRILKEILQKIDRESKFKEITVSEKVLGKYIGHSTTEQDIRGENSPDHRIEFMTTLYNLQKEGFLTINHIEYDFDARPIPTEEEINKFDGIFPIGEDVYFYPAEHCKVALELSNSESTEAKLLEEEAKYAIPTNKLLAAFEEDAEIKPKEQLYQDKIQLISKLLQVCSPEFLEVELRSPAHLAQSDAYRAGFDHKSIIEELKKKKVISKIKDLTYKQTSSLLYKVTVNYGNLFKFAEELHDEIEARGEVYGFDLQKRILGKIINEAFDQSPQNHIITISEEKLGIYEPQNPADKPAGLSLMRPDRGRPDIRFQFMRVLRSLEEDGKFIIQSVDFDFNAEPTPTPESKKRAIWAIGSDHVPIEFYPPAHCQVRIELKESPTIKNLLEIGEKGLEGIKLEIPENADPEPVITSTDNDSNNIGGKVEERGTTDKPYCLIEKSIGYLKFGKYGAKKKIGSSTARPFLFLQSTIDLIGIFKTVDAVFTAIWQEKDNKDQRLVNPATARARKVEILKNSCIKELQKDNKLNGKIRFEFNDSETQIKAVLTE